MLTQADAIKTLRDLADGVARLSGYFETAQAAAEPEALAIAPVDTVITERPSTITPPTFTPPADAELESTKNQIEELEIRAKQAQAALDDAFRSQDALEEDQKETRRQMEQETAKLSMLRAELAKAEELIKAASQHERMAAELERRERELAGEVAQLDARRRDVETKAADIARWSAASDEANYLKEKLWPGWLRAGSLAVWKEKLETAISSGSATPAAALLFAALHGYTAATKDSDLKLLHDSLREVSRRLFVWLRENGLDDHNAVETAGQWAAEINHECQSRAEVEIPAIGAPATNQWMIFRPRPGVNSPDVASVQTWCVRNAQKQPVHRAEVTV